jgi:hypothetical protein
MKEIIIALCTPDMHRPMAFKAVEFLKSTDLRRAELMILDNVYNKRFHHPAIMDEMLSYAAGRPVVFMDDDVWVNDSDWLERLWNTHKQTQAAIVGCIHAFPNGEMNHQGILVYQDGSTELLRQAMVDSGKRAYCPAVSSALVLVQSNCGLRFDRQFEKYQHDIDICISAWKSGLKTACSLDLKIIHTQAEYMSQVSGFRQILGSDIERFQLKWKAFASSGLYSIPELAIYDSLSKSHNWEFFYNQASRFSSDDPQRSAALFRQLVEDCPHSWYRASAYYHLFLLENKSEYLQYCLQQNPYHQKAAILLAEHTN